jgi:hydrogenase expression/formation protein HypC
MCLAVPGKIVSIDASTEGLRMAKVNFGGILKDICIEWLPEAGIGDYVLAHVGTALTKLDEEEARLTLQAFSEWESSLQDEPGAPEA